VAFEVFASRPLDVGELGLELNDRTATEYELVLPASGVIDGKTSIDFQPAPPPGAVALHLRAPGWGLTLGAVALPNS
jgi:hypothetical protein